MFLTQINLLDIELVRSFVRLALDDLTNAKITLGEGVQGLGESRSLGGLNWSLGGLGRNRSRGGLGVWVSL